MQLERAEWVLRGRKIKEINIKLKIIYNKFKMQEKKDGVEKYLFFCFIIVILSVLIISNFEFTGMATSKSKWPMPEKSPTDPVKSWNAERDYCHKTLSVPGIYKTKYCGNCLVNLDNDGNEEECEIPGHYAGTNWCNNKCKWSVCGNKKTEVGEECYDGNNLNNDGCSSKCRKAKCGDGFLWKNKEECDDGNTDNGDGCSSKCKTERCDDICKKMDYVNGGECIFNSMDIGDISEPPEGLINKKESEPITPVKLTPLSDIGIGRYDCNGKERCYCKERALSCIKEGGFVKLTFSEERSSRYYGGCKDKATTIKLSCADEKSIKTEDVNCPSDQHCFDGVCVV